MSASMLLKKVFATSPMYVRTRDMRSTMIPLIMNEYFTTFLFFIAKTLCQYSCAANGDRIPRSRKAMMLIAPALNGLKCDAGTCSPVLIVSPRAKMIIPRTMNWNMSVLITDLKPPSRR